MAIRKPSLFIPLLVAVFFATAAALWVIKSHSSKPTGNINMIMAEDYESWHSDEAYAS